MFTSKVNNMLKILKCDFTRIIINRGFAVAIIVTAVLCFSVQVYSDQSNEKVYSLIEALFTLDRGFMTGKSDFSPPVIINKALSGYSSMALPVTASFPFVLSFTAERSSGNMLYTISRTSRRKYYFSKFITAITGGGLCTMLGVILFGISVYILFPNVNSTDLITQTFTNNVFAFLTKKLLSAFVYGMTSALPAFFLCSFCKNSYIILCVPFMLNFISETLLAKFQANAGASGNFNAYDLAALFYPNAASNLVYRTIDKTFWEIVAVNVIWAVIVLAGFVIIMEKRSDRGR